MCLRIGSLMSIHHRIWWITKSVNEHLPSSWPEEASYKEARVFGMVATTAGLVPVE